MTDLLADAREWLLTQAGRIQTHSGTCHRWHPACLVSRLVMELDSRAVSQTAIHGDFDDDHPERENAEPAAIACGSDRTDKAAPRPAGTGDTPEAHATPGACRSRGGCTLTDAERQAVREAADAYAENDDDADCERIAVTLRGLLNRSGEPTKNGESAVCDGSADNCGKCQ